MWRSERLEAPNVPHLMGCGISASSSRAAPCPPSSYTCRHPARLGRLAPATRRATRRRVRRNDGEVRWGDDGVGGQARHAPRGGDSQAEGDNDEPPACQRCRVAARGGRRLDQRHNGTGSETAIRPDADAVRPRAGNAPRLVRLRRSHRCCEGRPRGRRGAPSTAPTSRRTRWRPAAPWRAPRSAAARPPSALRPADRQPQHGEGPRQSCCCCCCCC
eukprot:scaffold820_cov376-Prasinococcus_capsulatus_cf.AAC.3